jgi:hypothetical protein
LWKKPYAGVGVEYVRVGGKVIDVGLARDGNDKPDFIVDNEDDAIALIAKLRAEIVTEAVPVREPESTLIKHRSAR